MEKCLVALSGGVDSSVAARLMVDGGFDCVGGTMLLHGQGEDPSRDAEAAARRLDIPFCAFNCREEFCRHVMEDFSVAYARGRTPNPCIRCNRYMKFGLLWEKARQLGCDCLATGHYARVEYHPGRGRWVLLQAKDTEKDQSYFLYSLTQEQLKIARFPLGELKKEEIRALAREYGLPAAEKKDSQDVCFIPDGDYAAFLHGFTGVQWQPGDFVDTEGRVLGRHRGIIHYTVGQRRGLGIAAPEPLYVLRLDTENNRVVVGPDEALYVREVRARELNLIAMERISGSIRCQAKLRSRHTPAWATVSQPSEDELLVVFDEPQRAATPGQSVVLYLEDYVLGGGTIV